MISRQKYVISEFTRIAKEENYIPEKKWLPTFYKRVATLNGYLLFMLLNGIANSSNEDKVIITYLNPPFSLR